MNETDVAFFFEKAGHFLSTDDVTEDGGGDLYEEIMSIHYVSKILMHLRLVGQITIAIVNPVPYNSQGHFAILLIASSRKTHNLQLLESYNENPTYGSWQLSLVPRVEAKLVQ